MDCVAGLNETTTGPVIHKGYYLYSGYVGRHVRFYREEGAFALADVVGEISRTALPISSDS